MTARKPLAPGLAGSSLASRKPVLSLLVSLSLAWIACGAPPANMRVIDSSRSVVVPADGRRGDGRARIDPEDPRVVVTHQKLAELLEHPLAYELDDAVAAKFGDGLHEAYVAALESTARALVECQKQASTAFAYGARTLRTIHLAYTAVRGAQPAVALTGPALVLPVSSDRTELLDGSLLCPAFERGLAADSEGRFAKVEPKDVGAEEQAAYWKHLERARPRDGRTPAEQLEQARYCQRVIALEAHLLDSTLREPLNGELVSCGSWLREILRAKPTEMRLREAFDGTRARWTGWLNEHFGELSQDKQARLWTLLTSRADPERLAPSFDAPRFGLPVVEAWRRTFADGPGNRIGRLEDYVVAPVQGEKGQRLSLPRNYRGATYSDLARSPAGRRLLAERLRSWQSELLIETAVLHTLRDEGATTALALIEALATEPQLAHVGLRALALYDEWTYEPGMSGAPVPVDPRPLVAAAPAWWKQHPEHRAIYLYLLARIGELREGVVPWSRLGRFLGGRLDATTFDAFLALDPGNVWYGSQLTAALDRGWSRAPAVLRGLDTFLEAYSAGTVFRPLSQLLDRVRSTLCDGPSPADLEALRSFASERSEAYGPDVSRYLRSKTSTHCPGQAPERRTTSSEPVVFGD